MLKQKRGKMNKRLAQTVLVLLLSLAVIQTIQITYGQNTTSNNQWAMNFQIQNDQNATSNVFTPFEQVQLSANVTYGNATQPDILVTFKVQGPSGSGNQMNITRVAATNAVGVAQCSLRLPAEGQDTDSLIGTWQASATIQTTNGTIQKTLQKNLTFTTQWNIEITSMGIQNSQVQNQTIFYPGKTVTVQLAINNKGSSSQAANVTLDMLDSTGKLINQTQVQNNQIDASSTNPTQVQASIQIPDNAATGEATIIAAIYSGNYQNIDLPAGENKTAYFTIATNTAPTATPTPTPNIIENTISLFSWLLAATGFFTFTLLFMFLKRKPTPKVNTQMPNLPPTIPGPTVATPPLIQPTPQETASPRIAPEKIFQATIITQTQPDLYETLETPTKPTPTPDITSKPSSQSTSTQEPAQTIVTHLSRISNTARRVQTLQTALNAEKEQLDKEITDLNKIVEEQEIAVKNYFDAVRQEIEKLQTSLNNAKDTTTPQQKKPNAQTNKTETEN